MKQPLRAIEWGMCMNCGQQSNVTACPNECGLAYYCTLSCQQHHSSAHHRVCKGISMDEKTLYEGCDGRKRSDNNNNSPGADEAALPHSKREEENKYLFSHQYDTKNIARLIEQHVSRAKLKKAFTFAKFSHLLSQKLTHINFNHFVGTHQSASVENNFEINNHDEDKKDAKDDPQQQSDPDAGAPPALQSRPARVEVPTVAARWDAQNPLFQRLKFVVWYGGVPGLRLTSSLVVEGISSPWVWSQGIRHGDVLERIGSILVVDMTPRKVLALLRRSDLPTVLFCSSWPIHHLY
jgi:hypothetical protein